MQLTLIDHPGAAEALNAALAVRTAGGIPLITDPESPITPPRQATLPEGAAWAALTSGTTGAPKIVVRTNASWAAAYHPLTTELGLSPDDGVWMPVHQVSSMALFTAAWADATGLRLVVPTPTDAGLNRALAAHVTPRWLTHLLDLLEDDATSTIATVLVGGDTVPLADVVRAQRLGLRVITYVGATELSFVAWDTGHGLRPFSEVHTKIWDGVLWVASPHTALAVLGGQLRSVQDGERVWHTVGDRVSQHDGVLTLHGRTDGAMLSAGATVVPAHVESVIQQHPNVEACLVLGVDDAVLGQRITVWVQGPATVQQLAQWVRTRLPKAARPVQWHIVAHLPQEHA